MAEHEHGCGYEHEHPHGADGDAGCHCSGSGSELVRFSVTAPDDLLRRFDEQIARRGDVANRSEAVRDLTFQVAVIDENGMLVYSSIGPTTERLDLSQREHFRVHKESGGRDVLFISDPVQGKVSKKWSIQFTRPILRAGQFAGVVVVSVSPEQFASFANTLAIGKDGAATIIRESGQVLARVPNPTAGIEKPPRARQFNKPGALGTGNYRVVSGTDGVERIIGYHHVPEIGLYFLVGESVASVLAPYDGYRRTALVEAAEQVGVAALADQQVPLGRAEVAGCLDVAQHAQQQAHASPPASRARRSKTAMASSRRLYSKL